MRFVPDFSDHAASFELNVYGDPDTLASIEIGATGPSAGAISARGTCVRTMLTLLEDEGDRPALLSLKQETGRVERDGLTLEITPPTAPDAYGGWWVSVSDVRALGAARAQPEQLAAITVNESASKPEAKASAPKPQERQLGPVLDWKAEDFALARPAPPEHKERTVYVKATRVRMAPTSAPTRGVDSARSAPATRRRCPAHSQADRKNEETQRA